MGGYDAYLADLDDLPAESSKDRAAAVRQLEIANGHLAEVARTARVVRWAVLVLGGLFLLSWLGPPALRLLAVLLKQAFP